MSLRQVAILVLLSSCSFACAQAQENAAPTIAEDGPEMCFDAVRKALAPETNVVTISARYAPSTRVFGEPGIQPDELIACEVAYENRDNPSKLFVLKMDPTSRKFDDPIEVEVSFPDATTSSSTERFFIPLSKVNTSSLARLMEQKEAMLDNIYSAHSWTQISLKEPGLFNDTHLLRLDLEARIGVNDPYLQNGVMAVSVDGSQVISEVFSDSFAKGN